MALPVRILIPLILGVAVLVVVIVATSRISTPQRYRVVEIRRNGHDERCVFVLVQGNPKSEAVTVFPVATGNRPSVGDDMQGNLRGFGKDRQLLDASTNQRFVAEPLYHGESMTGGEAALSRDPCYKFSWSG
jgi:hypothetical protein